MATISSTDLSILIQQAASTGAAGAIQSFLSSMEAPHKQRLQRLLHQRTRALARVASRGRTTRRALQRANDRIKTTQRRARSERQAHLREVIDLKDRVDAATRERDEARKELDEARKPTSAPSRESSASPSSAAPNAKIVEFMANLTPEHVAARASIKLLVGRLPGGTFMDMSEAAIELQAAVLKMVSEKRHQKWLYNTTRVAYCVDNKGKAAGKADVKENGIACFECVRSARPCVQVHPGVDGPILCALGKSKATGVAGEMGQYVRGVIHPLLRFM